MSDTIDINADRLDTHGARLDALEKRADSTASDVKQLKEQANGITTQIAGLIGQIATLSSSINNANSAHQALMIDLISRSEDKIEEKMAPMVDILSGVRWTKRIMVATGGAVISGLVFLSTYGHQIADAIAVIRQQLGI